MNFNRKRMWIDVLILVVPVIIMLLITPILPDKVPLHWNIRGTVDRFIDRKYSFVLGALPFVIYESLKAKYGNRKR